MSCGVMYLIAACNLLTLLQQIIKPMSDSGQTWCSEQCMPPGRLSWGLLANSKVGPSLTNGNAKGACPDICNYCDYMSATVKAVGKG